LRWFGLVFGLDRFSTRRRSHEVDGRGFGRILFFLKMIVLEFTIAQYVNCASNARVFDLGRESREKKDPPVHHGKHYNTFASSSNRTTTRRLLVRQSNRLLTLDASVVVSAGNLSEGEQRFD